MATKGIEWVNKYHGRAGELSNNDDNAKGFYNTLDGVKQFEYADDMAWDQDFEQSGVGSPSAGTDTIFADNVDFCFFSGHGSQTGPFFGRADRDDGTAKNTECRFGDKSLNWIVFDACLCLEYTNVFTRWGPTFQGLHYILGFHTTTGDSGSRGQKFAQKLMAGSRIRDAWIKACEETEGSDCSWAYLRAGATGKNTYDDHWYGHGTVYGDPKPTDPGFYKAYANGPC